MQIDPVLIESELLDQAIDKLLDALSGHDPTSDEYPKVADQLTKLYKVKEIDSNIKLKAFEAQGKRLDNKKLQKLKGEELDQRENEYDTTHALKMREVEANLGLKQEEFILRREEAQTNRKLRAVEILGREQEIKFRRFVSPDTLAMIAGNIAGIVLIIGYERVNVIASKALGFVMRTR